MMEIVKSEEDLVEDIFDMNFLKTAFIYEMIQIRFHVLKY